MPQPVHASLDDRLRGARPAGPLRALLFLLFLLLLLGGPAPPAEAQVVDTVATGLGGPRSIAVSATGDLYVAGVVAHAIFRIASDGTVTTVAGYPGFPGHADGTGAAARFNYPEGIAISRNGDLFVADTGSHTIRKVTPDGVVTTFAGYPTQQGALDAQGQSARFRSPSGVAVDGRGNLFVADRGNHTIRRITPDGVVSTFVGVAGQGFTVDGPATTARILSPPNVAVDGFGNVYFADQLAHTIRRATPWGHVSTIAGTRLKFGAVDATGPAAKFYFPLGVAVDRAGTVYVADADNDTIRAITPAGVVTTIAGQPRVRGYVDGPAATASFRNPYGVAAAADGTVLVADTNNDAVRRVSGVAAPVFTRYLSEGASTPFFDTRIALFNPGTVDTTATLTFQTGDGRNVPYVVPVAAGRLVSVRAADVPALGEAEFSTTVASSELLVVDRTMAWGAGGYGSHGETAILAPSPTWYLAEGATHSGFSLFYLLQNPADVQTTARIRFLRTQGSPLEKTYVLPPRSRTNVWVNVEQFEGLGAALASAEVSAEVQSLDGQPIIVERAMYRSTSSTVFLAGHESAGQTTPAPRWFLAEGATGAYFDLFVLIANPTSDDATARLTYLLDGGQTFTRNLVVPANARAGVWVDEEQFDGIAGKPLADVAVSTTVESLTGVPLIVERAMWWPGTSATWHEAHNSAGATVTGTRWALADGEVGGVNAAETYLLIATTSASTGAATVTLFFEDGATMARTYALAPRSRTNVAVAQDFGLASFDGRVAAIVESTGTEPAEIVVERAVYGNANGVQWAAGRNALATRLR